MKKKKKDRRHSASSADTQLKPRPHSLTSIQPMSITPINAQPIMPTSPAIDDSCQGSYPTTPQKVSIGSATTCTSVTYESNVNNFALDACPSHEQSVDETSHDTSPPESPVAPRRISGGLGGFPRIGTNDIVRLNVGGHIFCTTITTLTRDPDSMLAAMFSGRFSPTKDSTGCVFIDRDGTYFRHILNYLRDGEVFLPEGDMQMRQELLAEAQFYSLYGLIESISGVPKTTKKEYLTIRYLPASTYDGWPVRIEGPLESYIVEELNGGSMPPEKDTDVVKNMYGQAVTGWKLRGIFLTKIFNIIAKYGWVLCTSNGSGGGKTRNFAEMYVFSRYKSYRRMKVNNGDRRQSSSYQYSHLFPTTQAGEDEILEQQYVSTTAAARSISPPAVRPSTASAPQLDKKHVI